MKVYLRELHKAGPIEGRRANHEKTVRDTPGDVPPCMTMPYTRWLLDEYEPPAESPPETPSPPPSPIGAPATPSPLSTGTIAFVASERQAERMQESEQDDEPDVDFHLELATDGDVEKALEYINAHTKKLKGAQHAIDHVNSMQRNLPNELMRIENKRLPRLFSV